MAAQVNRTALAESLGVSMPTIDRWIKEGMPVVQRGSRGIEWAFSLPDVINWQIERKLDKTRDNAPSDLDEIEKRTAMAKMLQAELALAKDRGDVAPIKEFEFAQAKIFSEIRTNVLNVAQRVVTQLLGETNERRFKDVLRAELTLALQAAAEAPLTLDEDEDEAED